MRIRGFGQLRPQRAFRREGLWKAGENRCRKDFHQPRHKGRTHAPKIPLAQQHVDWMFAHEVSRLLVARLAHLASSPEHSFQIIPDA
jgi:hypothetical protein